MSAATTNPDDIAPNSNNASGDDAVHTAVLTHRVGAIEQTLHTIQDTLRDYNSELHSNTRWSAGMAITIILALIGAHLELRTRVSTIDSSLGRLEDKLDQSLAMASPAGPVSQRGNAPVIRPWRVIPDEDGQDEPVIHRQLPSFP